MVMDFPAWESAVLGYDGLQVYTRAGWMPMKPAEPVTRVFIFFLLFGSVVPTGLSIRVVPPSAKTLG